MQIDSEKAFVKNNHLFEIKSLNKMGLKFPQYKQNHLSKAHCNGIINGVKVKSIFL